MEGALELVIGICRSQTRLCNKVTIVVKNERNFKIRFVKQQNIQAMNFDGLTPEQLKFILSLNQRIKSLEKRLVTLQHRQVKIDVILSDELAQSIKHLNLN